MNPTPTTRSLTPDLLLEQLDALLAGFTRTYQQLAAATQQHQDAIRDADRAAIGRATAAQSALVEDLARLEQRRRELIALACTRFAPLAAKRTTAITLTDLCACVPDRARAGITQRAADLRALVSSVEEQTRTIRAATSSLLAHMEGLMRQVGRQLSHAGTYSRRGYVDAGGMVVSAVDLRS